MAGSVLCISDEQAAWEAEIAGSSRELQGIRAGRLDRGAKPRLPLAERRTQRDWDEIDPVLRGTADESAFHEDADTPNLDGRPGAAAQREAVHWLGSRATGCAFLQPVVADPPGALLKSP